MENVSTDADLTETLYIHHKIPQKKKKQYFCVHFENCWAHDIISFSLMQTKPANAKKNVKKWKRIHNTTRAHK